uniref:Uncharacterized protein n=1 Tax=Rhizophora mucronata TaxID=61149 RepID=A0A2P2IIW5_RHIMU
MVINKNYLWGCMSSLEALGFSKLTNVG